MFDHRKSRAVAASKNTINSDWPQEERREGPDPCVSHCATSTVLPGKREMEQEGDSQAHPQCGQEACPLCSEHFLPVQGGELLSLFLGKWPQLGYGLR